MNILSLFDGMSCGQIALERAGIQVNQYFASEIDKYAIKVTQSHYPDTIQLGDVQNWKSWELPKIDLLIGGSPCQGFSNAGKGLNFDDPRSKLFFTYVDILKEIKPKFFLLENVKMKKEWQKIISKEIGLEPVLIDSALVSAQSRKRLYWANWDFESPKDKEIILENIIENLNGRMELYRLPHGYITGKTLETDKYPALAAQSPDSKYLVNIVAQRGRYINGDSGNTKQRFEYRQDKKSNSITSIQKDNFLFDRGNYRKLTPIEYERLQTVPDNWTDMVSNTQRYKMLSNGWTVDVIAHIFKAMPV